MYKAFKDEEHVHGEQCVFMLSLDNHGICKISLPRVGCEFIPHKLTDLRLLPRLTHLVVQYAIACR